MKIFKRFFNSDDQHINERKDEEKKRTLDDLEDCKFFELDIDEQNEKLVDDGYYYKVGDSGNINKEGLQFEVDPNLENVDQQVMITSSIRAKLPIKKPMVYKVNQAVVHDIFDHFEKFLYQHIFNEKQHIYKNFNQCQLEVEERRKRDFAYMYFLELHKFLCESMKLKAAAETELPKGVIENNALSRVYLYGVELRNNHFINDKKLIIRYLYCKESLLNDNIFKYHPPVTTLFQFFARRDMMIELNDKYGFEQNHPYTTQISKDLVFENHTELFSDKSAFDWMVDLLLKNDTKTPSFYNELNRFLKNEKLLIGKSVNRRFRDFINENFDENIEELRPKSQLTNVGESRIKKLKINLQLFRDELK